MTSVPLVPATFVLPKLTTIPDTTTTGTTTTGATTADGTAGPTPDQVAGSDGGPANWAWSNSTQGTYTAPGTGLTVDQLA